jgi:hypothetical protein
MFIECQGEEIQVYQLLVDGGIRWHSTEAMISRGILWCSRKARDEIYRDKRQN